jgi:hypothetical protein
MKHKPIRRPASHIVSFAADRRRKDGLSAPELERTPAQPRQDPPCLVKCVFSTQ